MADPAFTSAYPDLPLRDIYLMRNRLAHGYFEVDIVLVWNAVHSDIPALRKQVTGNRRFTRALKGTHRGPPVILPTKCLFAPVCPLSSPPLF